MNRKKSKKKESVIEKPIEVIKLPVGPYEKDGKIIEPPRKKDYELSPIETE